MSDKKLKDRLVNTKVDVNDGWADDVPIVYSGEGWKPDDSELTSVEIDPKSRRKKKKKKLINMEDTIQAESTVARNQKVKPFNMFMIIWLGALSITIAVLLGQFYDFLEKYEAAYQASRSYHDMDHIMENFEQKNVDVIYNLMTVKPEINSFETEENVKNYMTALLDGKLFSYKEAPNFNKDFPEYLVTADGYVIADILLHKNPEQSLEYGFPTWYVSSFTFYTEPVYTARIECPSNYVVSANGIKIGDEYIYENGIEVDDADNFEGYATLPTLQKYYIVGFYEEPNLSAVSCFKTECDVVWNESKNIYEVPFTESDEADEIREYAGQVVSDYALFSSNDSADNILDKYFLPDSDILPLIKMNSSRQYYTAHSNPYIENIRVTDFIMYDENTVHCRIELDEHMTVWGQDTIVDVHGDFFYIRTDDGWKVCEITY